MSFLKGDFIGRAALLEQESQGPERTLVAFEMVDRGIPREGYVIASPDDIVGEVTSGTFSPTLQQSIALARVDQSLELGSQVHIAVRKKRLKAIVAKYPFVKNGIATNSDIGI